MTGFGAVHDRIRGALTEHLKLFYDLEKMDLDRMEDLILATPARKAYQDIGADCIRQDTMSYLAVNLPWINVCLFVNEDFRACFKDAILIEKALLNVSPGEYAEFREEMTLASEATDLGRNRTIPVNLSVYDGKTDAALGSALMGGLKALFAMGMSDAYNELVKSLSGQELEDTNYVAYNLVFFVNALNRNGVFGKYVRIVIDNVKKQLAD